MIEGILVLDLLDVSRSQAAGSFYSAVIRILYIIVASGPRFTLQAYDSSRYAHLRDVYSCIVHVVYGRGN